jgi:hypothetical protein
LEQERRQDYKRVFKIYSGSKKKDDKKGPNRCNVNNKENLMKLVKGMDE